MAARFVTEEFRNEVKDLFEFFESHNIRHDSDHLGKFYEDVDGDDEEEFVYDEDTELTPWIPDSEFEESHTISDLLDMVYEAKNTVFFDEYKFVGKRTALIHIDYQILEEIFLFGINIPTVKEVIDEQEYTINIVNGLTSYGIKLIIDGNYNEQIPAVENDDTFIEIRGEDKIDERVIDSLVESYLFELKSTINISIHVMPRVSYYTEQYEEFRTNATRLRPLLRGKGVHELLKLYNSSLSTTNFEILVLTYTKVIEYVSQTVIQQDLIKSATKKLFSPKALNPDANYILELSEIFEGNRNNQKDYASIKLTIETCCDLNEIVRVAPRFLKFTNKLTSSSKETEIVKAYEEVANAISNTRNMFAHAKTNYDKKGMECPMDQLHEFTTCLDILSQQVIRWFAKEHEDNRVI
ncbi:MAG: hypothetical protein WBV93_00630 [Anaerobacillus sp.]